MEFGEVKTKEIGLLKNIEGFLILAILISVMFINFSFIPRSLFLIFIIYPLSLQVITWGSG